MATTSEWVSVLSVKQAKLILKAKGIDSSQVVEKSHLLSLVNENVKSKEDADELINNHKASQGKENNSSNKTSEISAENLATAQTALNKLLNLPFKQLIYQSKVMKRDPDYVRRNNASLKFATNEMIIKTAEEMESKAELMNENPKEIQKQEDMANANQFYDMLINHPVEFKKKLFQTMKSMKVYESQFDEPYEALRKVAKSNEVSFKWYIAKGISVLRTLQEAFNILQKLTFGYGKIVLFFLFLFISYMWIRIGWYILMVIYSKLFGSSSSPLNEEGGSNGFDTLPADMSSKSENTVYTQPVASTHGTDEDEWGF